jgi:hypothetical protein
MPILLLRCTLKKKTSYIQDFVVSGCLRMVIRLMVVGRSVGYLLHTRERERERCVSQIMKRNNEKRILPAGTTVGRSDDDI